MGWLLNFFFTGSGVVGLGLGVYQRRDVLGWFGSWYCRIFWLVGVLGCGGKEFWARELPLYLN